MDTDSIDLESRDEHIPWAFSAVERTDLIAGARLLAALHRCGNADTWDFEMFPGGLYKDNHLVIPLPAWYPDDKPPNDLSGLKALIDAIKQHGDGYIEKLSILLLDPDSARVIPDSKKRVLKELVSLHIAIVRFARGTDIEEVELEDL